MTSLKADIVKRVKRLPKPSKASEAMIPLFEAISNSIHSTIEKFGDDVLSKGRVDVTLTLPSKGSSLKIIVSDNGHGLNDKNYEAFITTDTDNKITIGGKGVGRLLWLDCFDKISVKSNYQINDKYFSRAFNFCLSNEDQIQNLEQNAVLERVVDTGVIISFEGLQDNAYNQMFPSRAQNCFQFIASHFLPAFINKHSPRVIVTTNNETKEYPGEIKSFIFREHEEANILSEDFGEMRLVMMECDKLVSSDLKGNHFVHFIAHDRTVVSKKIDAKLGLKYFGDGSDRTFHACLYGDFLNGNVNQERTSFNFEDKVIETIITKVCMPFIEKFLEAPLSVLREEQQEVVKQVVRS